MSHPDQDKKYVVYHEPRGKTPKGIYRVKVLLTKDHAIVPTGRGVVTFSERTGYSSARYEENTYVFPRGTDESIKLNHYSKQYIYARKTEAERQHAILWNEAWTKLTENDLALTEAMTALKAAKPRSRKKKKA